jgi:hypothetical protein
VPPARYAQVVASGASLKTRAYAFGTAITGPLSAVWDARQTVLAAAAVNVPALLVLDAARGDRPAAPRMRSADVGGWRSPVVGTEWGTVPHGSQPISAEFDLPRSA